MWQSRKIMITYKQLFITKFNLKVAVAQYLIYIFILGRTDFHSPLSSFLSWDSKYKNIFWVYSDHRNAHEEIVMWYGVQFIFSFCPHLLTKWFMISVLSLNDHLTLLYSVIDIDQFLIAVLCPTKINK